MSTTPINNLRNTVLVGKLSLTNWEAKRKAKGVEQTAERVAGAKAGTISARKALLPGAAELEAVIKHAQAMRNWWGQVSAPWFDNGMRVYAVAGHIDIQVAYGDMLRQRLKLIGEFLDKYPALREDARFTLNDLFDEAEYPTPEEVSRKFHCSFEVMPLPDAGDFRLVQGIDPSEMERLQHEAQKSVEDRVNTAMRSTIERFRDALKTMADRMAAYSEKVDANDPKSPARFYDSWVTNVQEIAGLLPQLNVTGDPRLEALAKEAATIAAGDPAAFRNTHDKRVEATARTNELLGRLHDLFG